MTKTKCQKRQAQLHDFRPLNGCIKNRKFDFVSTINTRQSWLVWYSCNISTVVSAELKSLNVRQGQSNGRFCRLFISRTRPRATFTRKVASHCLAWWFTMTAVSAINNVQKGTKKNARRPPDLGPVRWLHSLSSLYPPTQVTMTRLWVLFRELKLYQSLSTSASQNDETVGPMAWVNTLLVLS